MAALTLLLNANSPSPESSLLDSFTSQGAGQLPEFTRGDTALTVQIMPVIPDPSGVNLWAYDSLLTDIYRFAIGNADTVPTSGLSNLTLGGHAFVINAGDSAATVTTAAQVASTANGNGTVTAILLAPSSYQLTWTNLAAVPAVVEASNTLNPASTTVISVLQPGDSGTQAVQIIRQIQQPLVYNTPTQPIGSRVITAISLANPTQVTTATPHGFITGDTPVFTQCNSNPTINGTRAITVIDAYNFTVNSFNVSTAAGTSGYAYTAANPSGAGLTNSTVQAPSATLDAIRSIMFNASGTYGGTFGVTVQAGGLTQSVGIASPNMSATDFATLLANHPNVKFNNSTAPNNVSVSATANGYTTEGIGTLASAYFAKPITAATVANPTHLTIAAHGFTDQDSVTISSSAGTTPSLNGSYTATKIDANTISVPVNVTATTTATGTAWDTTLGTFNCTGTNINLAAPLGVFGTINLNTVNLAKYFMVNSGATITLTGSVERQRTNGEIKTLWLNEGIIVHRDLIDVTALQSMPNVGTIYAGTSFRIIPITNGGKIQASLDGGVTWEDFTSYVAT